MKSLNVIEQELRKLGVRNQFWCKPEIKELANILTDDEIITKAANGRYQGGFALIVTTNHRLLLIDKKMWFMSLEDVRFDMITEVDYAARIFDATISVRTVNKVLHFTSIHQHQLRELTKYLQERIMEIRQMMMQQSDAPAQSNQIPVQLTMVAQQAPAQSASPSMVQAQPQQDQPTQTTTPVVTPVQPVQQLYYTRPSRFRRVGAIPAASLTMQNQRYMTARR